MGTFEIVVRCAAGVGLLALNGFFVATEFAMTRVPQFDKSEFEGSLGLERAWEMTSTLEIYLTACQVGITITSILLGVVFEPGLSAIIHPLAAAIDLPFLESTTFAVIVSVMTIQLAHTVWGEQSPTYFGVERPKTVVKYCSIPLYWWTTAVYPLIYVGDHLAKGTLGLLGVKIERSWREEEEPIESRSELRRQLVDLLAEGPVPEEQREEVVNALEIVDTPTEEIMIPREEIVTLSTANSPEENFEVMCNTHHARYPLVGASVDEFEGIVYAPSLFPVVDELRSGELGYDEVAVEPMTVAPDCSVSELIDRFQNAQQELALVVEEGRTLGLVTSTDAFEEVTGELEDPFD